MTNTHTTHSLHECKPIGEAELETLVQPQRQGQAIDGIRDALAPKRRGRGLSLSQRLRLVAVRLEAGMRETPERFYAVAKFVAGLGPPQRRRFLHFLATEALAEASSAEARSPATLALLHQACDLLAQEDACGGERWQALASDILDAAPSKRRRRHIHCHGVVTTDRQLLLLRGLVAPREADTFQIHQLRWTIAYAMADYDTDHFVLEGQQPARRVRALIGWIERMISEVAPYAV